MSASHVPDRRLGRSVVAVLAGFVAVAILSIATDAVMYGTGIFTRGGAMPDALFLLAAGYRVAFTVLGGFITAKLAPNRANKHVLILGAVGTIFATVGAVATWNAGPELGPHWYSIALVVTGLPSVLLGERLAEPGAESARA